MPSDDVAIAIKLRGAREFARDANVDAGALRGIGTAARGVTAAASTMGGAVSGALRGIASQARYASLGLGAVGLAGVKMGLSTNAQLESARLRFGLFTSDVDGLVNAVSKIDMASAFNLTDLTDAAALFGNSGVQNIPEVLQATANAAAASGKGTQALNSIAIALSQIQSKGKLSQEEINQLNEAGAPGAQATIAKAFNLTADELQNLGANGLDATEAIRALTTEWTSGRMAKAAEAQTKGLAGQWNLLTGNVQKLSGAVTEGLAKDLRDDVLPAANDTAQALTGIFSNESLTDQQKMRQALGEIRRRLGPIADQIGVEIEQADIPKALGDALDKAGPVLLEAGKDAAGTFIDAWTEAPVWAQVLSVAWLSKKMFGGAGAAVGTEVGMGIGRGVSRGIGEKVAANLSGSLAGKLAEGFLGRGGTPANPLFVLDVAGGPASRTPVPIGNVAKKVGAGAVASRFAAAAPPLAAATVLAAGLHAALPEGAERAINQNHPSGAGRGSAVGAGTVPAPGFGNRGLQVNVPVSIDGRTVARATAVYDQVETGRLAASAAARR